MTKHDQPAVLSRLKTKYYRTFLRRVSSKAGHLAKPDKDQKTITRLRAELERLSFKFRAVFDHSHSYYVILDKGMNIIDYNKASLHFIRRLFGKRMIIGDNILNLIHPSSADMVTESCDRAFTGEKFILEKKICYLDKSITHWSFEFSPAFDLRGNITGLVFNANDITKRITYEEKIMRQHKKLVEIASMQSHEIRGPVSTIMGLMSLIKGDGYKADKEYLMLMEITTDALDKNIREIVNRANDDDQ